MTMYANRAHELIDRLAAEVIGLGDAELARLNADAHAIQAEIANGTARTLATGIVLLTTAETLRRERE